MTDQEGAYLREIRRLKTLMRLAVKELRSREVLSRSVGADAAVVNTWRTASLVAADALELSAYRRELEASEPAERAARTPGRR